VAAAVEVSISGRVGICRINRPDTRNAIDAELAETLIATLEQLDADAAVRCIVLTGTGEYFATGHDIRAFSGREAGPPVDVLMTGFWRRLRAIGTPIIAAVNGWALAFGCELALACDLMVVGKETTFGLPEVTFGLIPAGGATQRLTRVIGKQRTMELVLSGRRMSGKQAFAWGLANILADKRRCLEGATALAEDIAERPPLALRFAKRAIVGADETGLEEGLERERQLLAEAMATEDRIEAVNALLEGRPADFSGK
jgi:enoyl-CoA hydratase/carnithine racemase